MTEVTVGDIIWADGTGDVDLDIPKRVVEQHREDEL